LLKIIKDALKMLIRFILLLIVISNPAYAQKEYKVLTQWLPFEIIKKHIVVEIYVKGSLVKAVLDTGSTVSLIQKDVAKRLGVRRSRKKVTVKTLKGPKNMVLSKPVNVRLPALFEKKINLYIYDKLSSAEAIIGMDFMAYDLIQLDYLNKRLRFATPNVFQFKPQSAIPLTKKGLRYFLTVSIDNVSLEMLLDSGNASAIIIPFSKIKDTKIHKIMDMPPPQPNQKALHYFAGVSDDFKIGPHTLENVRYHVFLEGVTLPINQAILGHDILKNFIVTMDLINNNLYLSALN
jgi:predicted aspartyl protease